MSQWILAGSHLLALGIGMSAIWLRAVHLKVRTAASLRAAFNADSAWAAAAVLWIGTGLVRMLGGTDKGTDYYLASSTFQLKMVLLLIILGLEIWPMVKLIRWRIDVREGTEPDLRASRSLSRISQAQFALVVVMVFVAAAMARGYQV